MYHYTREEKKISGRVKLHIGDMQGKVNQDDSVSTIKCDDLSPLKYLCVGYLHHTTISLAKFQHPSMVTFLHLNIYVWVTSTTLLYPWFSFNILLYPDSGISMDEEIVLGVMMWSYNKAEL